MAAHRLRRALAVSLLVLLTPVVPAQDQPDASLQDARRRFAAGQPLWDVKFKVDDNGELLMWPSPSAGGASDIYEPFLPLEMEGIGWRSANLGALGFLSLLCSGGRDLASLGDAEQVLRTDGVDTSDAGLRQALVTPVTEPTPGRARRAELRRILAARLLQERRVAAARGELQAVARDGATDPFLAQACRDALLAIDGGTAPRAELSDAMLRVVPADADLVVFLDQARIPPSFWLPRLAREVATEVTLQQIELAGGQISPAMLAGAMQMAETSSRGPFELARRFGNARMEQTLLALRLREERVEFLLDAPGRYDVQRIATTLRDGGVALEPGETLQASDLPFGNTLEMTADRLRVHHADLGAQPDGDRAAALRQAGAGASAIWVHVPPGSKLLTQLELPATPRGATLGIDFAPHARVVLRTEHELPVHSQGLASLLEGYRRQGETQLDDLPGSPSIDRIAEALAKATIRTEEKVLTVTLDLVGVTPDDVRLLLLQLVRGGLLR